MENMRQDPVPASDLESSTLTLDLSLVIGDFKRDVLVRADLDVVNQDDATRDAQSANYYSGYLVGTVHTWCRHGEAGASAAP